MTTKQKGLFALISKYKWGYILILPWVIYFLVFQMYPLILSFNLTFYDYNFARPDARRFVGFANWIEVIKDPLFLKSLRNILYNQAINITVTFILALGTALLLKEISKGGALFRTIYFAPVITSIVVAFHIGFYLIDPQGPLQKYLLQLGIIKEAITWQIIEPLPMPVIAVFNAFKWFGLYTVIFLGGLISINPELYEAAEIDGANRIRKFFHITIPQINPQILFFFVWSLITGLQLFTEVFMNWDLYGGINNCALTPVLYIYDNAFDRFQAGYAATIAIYLAIFIFILTLVQLKFMQKETE